MGHFFFLPQFYLFYNFLFDCKFDENVFYPAYKTVYYTNYTAKGLDNYTSPKLLFGMITTDDAYSRRDQVYQSWVSKAVELGHEYIFITDNEIGGNYKYSPLDVDIKSLQTNKIQHPANINREQKRFAVARYFIQHSTASFCFNTCDDVMLDIEKINKFGALLSQRFDTEKDIAFIGNCEPAGKAPYIQGGSGFIMTRAAAREFLRVASTWIAQTRGPDDVELERMLNLINLSSYHAMSPYFVGHPFIPLGNQTFDLNKIPECPIAWENKCGQGVHRFDDIVLIHESDISKHRTIWRNYLTIKNDNESIYGWYDIWPTAYACKINPFIQYPTRDLPGL